MVALYVTAREKGSGNTAVCAGLGKLLINDGKKPGYLKPMLNAEQNTPPYTDSDVEFIKKLFSLDEPLNTLCPVISGSDLAAGIKEALSRLSQGKDVVIIDGPPEQYQASSDIAKELNARLLIVEPYSDDFSRAIVGYKGFGQPLLGVIFNKVPNSRMGKVSGEIAEQLEKVGVKYLGALPEDRTLFAITIGELTACIDGEMLRGNEKSAELVENLMLGAMTVDSGPEYFGRKENKAAIIRSGRPDMQLAAISTSTRCLVLTGDTAPKPAVIIKAEENNIPVITTKADSATVIEQIEEALSESKMNQESKLSRLEKLMTQNLDSQFIYKELGLAV